MVIFSGLLAGFSLSARAEIAAASVNPIAEWPVLRAGLEPFPPLILENGGGESVDWLKAAANSAGYRLHIIIMPYSRAKIALSQGEVDIIGHTPYGYESPDFYHYARELSWSIETSLDAFARDPERLSPEALVSDEIGTPFGNAEFLAALLDLPHAHFIEGRLDNLSSMLTERRLDILMFERASVMNSLQKDGAGPVYYRQIMTIPAGFAVARQNRLLADRLDKAMRGLNEDAYFAGFRRYLDMPETGIVP